MSDLWRTVLNSTDSVYRKQKPEVRILSDFWFPTSDIRYQKNLNTYQIGKRADLYDLVIIARKEPPVPISNTTVKLLSADGTMSQGMGEYVVARSYKSAFLFITIVY